jgi:hypothetical protein
MLFIELALVKCRRPKLGWFISSGELTREKEPPGIHPVASLSIDMGGAVEGPAAVATHHTVAPILQKPYGIARQIILWPLLNL